MRVILVLLQKEFRQIFRNPAILRVILVMPVMQLLIFPLAADYEVRHVSVDVVDQDHSTTSAGMIAHLDASKSLHVYRCTNDYDEALEDVEHDRADIVVNIPPRFERTLMRESKAGVYVASNAINGVKAGMGTAYVQAILREYQQQLASSTATAGMSAQQLQLSVIPRFRYNQHLDYHAFMVPGILVQLLTMVGVFLTALNIVREKEIGTIEQIHVTPLRSWQFILGKLLPFLLIGNVVFTLGMVVARFAYGIVPLGSMLTLYAFVNIYLVAVLGLGLFISVVSVNQQQAMFVSYFFIMVFLLLGGLFTPVESMPEWAQALTRANPMAYFIRVIRMIVLKGSGMPHLMEELRALTVLATGVNVLAIALYRKRA